LPSNTAFRRAPSIPRWPAACAPWGVPCVENTLTGWYGGELSVESLIKVLKEGLRDSPAAASFELMCHPGFVDDDLARLSRYVNDRERVLATLCNETFGRELAAAGFSLTQSCVAVSSFAGPTDVR
jgi:predicted glycoside hydrolase/deacetylase ChbG (UPF0249 family)